MQHVGVAQEGVGEVETHRQRLWFGLLGVDGHSSGDAGLADTKDLHAFSVGGRHRHVPGEMG